MLKNKIRKLLALVLAGVMITGMEIPVHAATVWTGGVDTSWYTGNKSSYDISTPEQLAGFAKLVRDAAHEDRFRGVTINLTDDIILNDTSSIATWSKNAPANVWDPIGRIGSPVMGYCPFAGCFNGNGHTISGMYVNTDRESGLFCYTSGAVIKNVNIADSVVINSKENSSGSLVGVAESTYFDNCGATNIQVIGSNEVGGLVGKSYKVNSLIPFMQVAMMGFGVVVNPMVFGSVPQEAAKGTYFNNCRVNVAYLKSAAEWNSPAVGGIIGHYYTDGGLANCATNAITAHSVDKVKYSTVHTGPCGAVIGKIEWNGYGIKDVAINGCVTNAFQRTDTGTARSDADKVPSL